MLNIGLCDLWAQVQENPKSAAGAGGLGKYWRGIPCDSIKIGINGVSQYFSAASSLSTTGFFHFNLGAEKMAKQDSTDPTTELKDIISSGRKKSLNFAMMKSKEGVVLKAHVTKASGVMVRECKAAGGVPSMQAKGTLSVRGKRIEMILEDPDVSPTLAKHAKKYLVSLGFPYKIIFLLPGGASVGEDEDSDVEAKDTANNRKSDAPPNAVPQDVESAPKQESSASHDTTDTGDPSAGPNDALRAVLMTEFDAMSSRIEAVKVCGIKQLSKKVETVEGVFLTTVEENPSKARGVLTLLSNTLEKVPATSAPDPETVASSGNRMADLEALEKSVDNLLAEFA